MSAAKDKGSKWERDIVAFLKSAGIKAYRPAQSGFRDHGDIHGVSPFVIQAKDWRDVLGALRAGVDSVPAQAENAGERYGIAVVKRARRKPAEAYAVMRLEDFARLLLEIRASREAPPEQLP